MFVQVMSHTFLFFFTFYSCIVPMGFLPWEILVAFPGKASCDWVTLPNPQCMLGVLLFPNPLNSDMDYGIFNVHTDVNACDCTWGCTDTVRVSALKVDSRRKIPCHTRESNLSGWHASLMLYLLSNILTFTCKLKPVFFLISRCMQISKSAEPQRITSPLDFHTVFERKEASFRLHFKL